MVEKVCLTCGEDNPSLFYQYRKGKCKKCESLYYLNRLEQDASAKLLNKNRARKWQNDHILRYRLLSCKNRAKLKGWCCNITIQDLEEILQKQDGKCFYTGIVMLLQSDNENDHSISIDRYDSSIGYTKENIVLCISRANSIKNDLTYLELVKYARLIIEQHKIKEILV